METQTPPCQTPKSSLSNESNSIVNGRVQEYCMHTKKSSEGMIAMPQTKEKDCKHTEEHDDDQSKALMKELPPAVCERNKMHREGVGGGAVLIPERWSEEQWLKEWMDCSSFDSLLAPKGVSSARRALVADGRRNSNARSHRFTIQKSYYC